MWAYIDVYDLADALRLAAEREHAGHEVDLHRLAGQPRQPAARGAGRATTTARRSSCASSTARTPAGISIAQGRGLIGYDPSRSWRDYLTDDGELRPEAARAARARRDRRPARARRCSVLGRVAGGLRGGRATRGRGDAGGLVGVVHVERLVLQQALGEAVELLAVLAEQRA